MQKMYAVYRYTRFQDGHEEGWHIFETLKSVEEYINPNPNRHSDQTTYRVFEVKLVRELKFKTEITEIPQPPTKEARTKVFK